MLVLDFINVGNGDSTLIREMEDGVQKFAMLVDCGHDNLIRDDHHDELDPRTARIYAGDFLRKNGVTHLDLLLVTQSGIMIRTGVDNIRTAGRATQGVIVMRFKEEGDQVIAMALTEREAGEVSTETEEVVETEA